MRDLPAIELKNVSKVYRLYGSQRDQLLDVLGLARFGFLRRRPVKEFKALDDVSLVVPKGHRIGIIGRNGAGKTTLLKLISGNFSPSSGQISVNGTVQALLSMGLGFHPEFTGRENVRSSLQYNGLSGRQYQEAVDDIIDFCELGEFIDQPFKTYSMGMQARLMFAVATAVQPEILIVDEVLGAGDSYFIAKSKQRIERLVQRGCTMLLVSHSTQQILELCREAVWLDSGRVRMQGDAFLVVKAYEEYVHGLRSACSWREGSDGREASSLPSGEMILNRQMLDRASSILLQEPWFLPHQQTPQLIDLSQEHALEFNFQAPGGISRWAGDPSLRISGFSVVTPKGVSNELLAMEPAKLVFFLTVEKDGAFQCRYGIAIHDLMGTCITRVYSPPDQFEARSGEIRKIAMMLNPNQMGPGQYTVGISVLQATPLEQVDSAKRYDLLSRSFTVHVRLPDSLAPLSAMFFQTAEWQFTDFKTD